MPKTGLTALACVVAALGIVLATQPAQAQEAVQFKAAGGVTVYGAFYAAQDSSRPMILLFHQASSNRYEYTPIAPKLVAAGFSCLAIDQRWGGEMWGHRNETVRKLGHSENSADEVSDLQADLEAALEWAHTGYPHRKFILWGSSYSASLVFAVAAGHPNEVAGVLAFSPGEYFQSSPTLVEDAATRVHVPVFITSENDADQLRQATLIFNAVGSRDKVHYKAAFAVHGSSTLRADRDPKGAAANWAAVMKFLKQFEK
jgi:alpha-beta hydrolase superfamily lysophospholipase